MKKYLSILAITALAASAFAQGTVTFANGPTSTVKLGASATDPAAVNMPTPGFAALFYAPANTPLVAYNPASAASFLTSNPLWKLAAPKGLAAAGRFSGGAYTLDGIAAGATAIATVVAWNGNFASYDAAVAGNASIGVAPTFNIATGGVGEPPTTPTSIVTAGFAGTTAFPQASVVPEPSSLALAGLGAAALLIFRRRK